MWWLEMNSLHEFLTMGGYAWYVWPAYGLAAIVMVANALSPGNRLRRLKMQIRRGKGGGA
jgi:heme exporter protein D